MKLETTPFRHRYGHYSRVQVTFTGVGRTKQSFKDECDINNLMAKYLKSGHMDHVNQALPRFEDVTSRDFQGAQNLIADALSMFEDIPSKVRNRFDNDPGKLLDWVHDPRNAEEAAQLGFLNLELCPAEFYKAPEAPPAAPAATSKAP
ncbi:MAG: internal scaffolding protein [Microvirus sp.]|nr:MAG: internal scaffolding protein [Microvirus sp.]